jgi:probable rRNA maturation factor
MTPTPRRRQESPAEDAEPPSSALSVEVANQTQAACDARRIEAAVRAALAYSPYTEGAISVAVVDNAAIHRLNRRYLEHDWPTDVITFPLADDPPHLEGEIVVSHETAEQAAAEAGWSADNELLLYVVHGALHLGGYDDHAPADLAAMRAREAAVLDGLGVRRSAADSRWEGLPPSRRNPEASAP